MMNIKDLFEAELKDIYDAEHRLVEALQEMMKETTDPKAKKAFTSHLDETKNQVKRLDKAFKEAGIKAERKECHAVVGLIDEHKEVKGKSPDPKVMDVFNVMAGIKTERYEISAYEGLSRMAIELGMAGVADILEQNLEEEEKALDTLMDIRESLDIATLASSVRRS